MFSDHHCHKISKMLERKKHQRSTIKCKIDYLITMRKKWMLRSRCIISLHVCIFKTNTLYQFSIRISSLTLHLHLQIKVLRLKRNQMMSLKPKYIMVLTIGICLSNTAWFGFLCDFLCKNSLQISGFKPNT